jgi:hypothetical protein
MRSIIPCLTGWAHGDRQEKSRLSLPAAWRGGAGQIGAGTGPKVVVKSRPKISGALPGFTDTQHGKRRARLHPGHGKNHIASFIRRIDVIFRRKIQEVIQIADLEFGKDDRAF